MEGIESESRLVGPHRPFGTVFWGGGTPGLLSARQIERLAAVIRPSFGGQPVEWTVELAPGSVTDERLSALKAAGVTRLSLGIQSFNEALLKALERGHSPAQIHRAYDRIRAAGFASVNIDLMFALPGQTAAEWESDLSEALRLDPDHLSTYCLTFEEDTALWVKLSQGRVKLDPDNEARMYERTWDRLAESGFSQYEVSNFSKPGHACRHNLNTWSMHEWIGLGPSAASQYAGSRGANESDLTAWRADLGRGERGGVDRIAVTPALLAEDALIFGLRMNAGVDLSPWRDRCPDAPWIEVEGLVGRLEASGLAVQDGSRVSLSRRGRLLADSVGAEVMAAFEVRPAA